MGRIRVLVVDDSVVLRRLVTAVLEDDPEISVVGSAASGRTALAELSQVAPDCVTLDMEMPELDGPGTLRALRRSHPRLPVVLFSTLSERAARATLDTLALGADDDVCKPAGTRGVPLAIASVRDQLVPEIEALCPPRPRAAGASDVAGPSTPVRRDPAATGPLTGPLTGAAPAGRVDVLAIGASTGGPAALSCLLPQLPASFPVPVVVVQHMPPAFTRTFAQRLDSRCALEVEEAEDGDLLQPGRVLIAPGDRHLELVRLGACVVAQLTSAPPQSLSRPAVDVLFRSVAHLYGAYALSLVLSGSGTDGARGAADLRRAGAEVVVQDAASSAVWDMPGTVAGAGLAHRVVPVSAIASDVSRVVARGRAHVLAGPTR